MESQSEALRALEALACSFATQNIDIGELRREWAAVSGPLDPRDSAARMMSGEELRKLCAWDRLSGGAWNEFIDEEPRREDWVYGESHEEYGWIDKPALRRRYRAYLKALGVSCPEDSGGVTLQDVSSSELLDALLDIHEAIIRAVARWQVSIPTFLDAYDAFFLRGALDGHEAWPSRQQLHQRGARIRLHERVWLEVESKVSGAPDAAKAGLIDHQEAIDRLTMIWDEYVDSTS